MDMKPRILMVGPDRKEKGGIASVVSQYYEHNLCDLIDLKYISTSSGDTLLSKYIHYIASLFKCIYNMPFYDILHIHMASRGSYYRKRIIICLAKKVFQKTVLIHLHGAEFQKFYLEECNRRKKDQIKKTFDMSDGIIALSDEWKKFLSELTDSDKICVIHNAVAIQECKQSYTKNSILFLGRLGKRKGIYDVISILPELIKEYPDLRLYVAGDGEISRCQKICKEMNIEDYIEFKGWLDRNRIIDLFKECSIFVLPSYHEGLPMSMLEAMSHGLAVVVTAVGGIPSVISQNYNGLLIKAGDGQALRESIDCLLKDKNFCSKIGRQGYATVKEHYSIECHIKQLVNMYMKFCPK